MKKFTSIFLSGLLGLAASLSAAETEIDLVQEQQIIGHVVAYVNQAHYAHPKLDDVASEKLFNDFLISLDPQKIYFRQGDIKSLAKYKNRLDDMLKRGDASFSHKVNEVFLMRITERNAYAAKVLQAPFDFTKKEMLNLDFDKLDFVSTVEQQQQLWHKILKNELLILQLSAEKSKIVDKLTPAQRVLKKYEGFAKVMKKRDRIEVLTAFLKAYTLTTDPHSEYWSNDALQSFQRMMSLSLKGIGVMLRSENGYATIKSVVTGGPAFKQGELKMNDIILAVSQEGEGDLVDVAHMPLSKIIPLITGKVGTTVRLSILSDGAVKEVKIVRDEIKLTDSAASGEVRELERDGVKQRLGYILLPGFYSTCHADIEKVLKNLLSQGELDGLVFDLRGNGGGSLDQVVKICSMFIDDGPIVFSKTSRGDQRLADTSPGFAHKLPMVVLVDRGSASASEIFAGVMQDYGRALIIGDSSTFGKGSIQSVLPFRGKDLGAIKLTTGKFYRASGKSTQFKGVVPDIIFPSFFDTLIDGEKSLKHVLPWDTLSQKELARFEGDVAPQIKELSELSATRMAANEGYQKRVQNIKDFAQIMDDKTLPLNIDERRKFQKLRTHWSKLAGYVTQAHKSKTAEEDAKGLDITDYRLAEGFEVLQDLIKLKK